MKIYKLKIAVFAFIFISNIGFGQNETSFSLEEAEVCGVNNNEKVKNVLLDVEIAKKKVWETTAIGLPQAHIEGQFQQLIDIPTSVVDASLFNPLAPPGEVMEFRMGQEFSSSAAFNVSQLVFDGSYIVGLQFSNFYIGGDNTDFFEPMSWTINSRNILNTDNYSSDVPIVLSL